MIYPSFLKKNSTIGICAPSAGVGDKAESFDSSLNTLKNQGWNIKETHSVRLASDRGGNAEVRGKELTSLFMDPGIDLVMSAAGGDFLLEMLPYVNWEELQKHPKFLCGASDPTSLLFTYTVKYDVASIYGFNAGSFDTPDMPYVQDALSILNGNLISQHSSDMHAEIADFLPEYNGCDTPTVWKSNVDEMQLKGRCIGGCIDVLKDIIGTKYDAVDQFINKYKSCGFIWYFDDFSMSAEVFYRTLLQFRYAGWLKYAKAVIVGRVLFPSSETGMSYDDALSLAIPDIPYIYEADIGHTVPSFTLINGAMMNLDYKDGKGSISFDLT